MGYGYWVLGGCISKGMVEVKKGYEDSEVYSISSMLTISRNTRQVSIIGPSYLRIPLCTV